MLTKTKNVAIELRSFGLPLWLTILLIIPLPLAAAEKDVSQGKPLNYSSGTWSVNKIDGKIIARNPELNIEKVVSTDSEGDNEVIFGEIASLVGPILSIRKDFQWDGGVHPGRMVSIETINLDTGKSPVLLTEIFPEEQITNALLQDRVVMEVIAVHRSGSQEDIVSLKDIMQLDPCEYSFRSVTTSFAFHHLRNGNVAVRIGLPHGCEVMRGNYTELGIYLPIPQSLAGYLAQAEKNHTLQINYKSRRNVNPTNRNIQK